MAVLGSQRIRITTYHPAANGLVERFHRQLKSSMIAIGSSWYKALPFVLLGVRNTIKTDLQTAPVELVRGAATRLPGEFFETDPNPSFPQHEYARRLMHFMSAMKFMEPRTQITKSQIDSHLQDCTHVYVRVDAVRKSPPPPYDGPFIVLERFE